MYRDAYQRGMLTVFFSGGSKPLEIWETQTKDGYIKRFLDPEIKTMVMEICGANISTTYMICPKGSQVLGITMPFLVMVVKNLKKYFSFEVTILDETGTRRRFRVSNFQSTTQILPLCTVMPIGLSTGWNQIQFNLAEFTRRAYKKQFVEVQKLKVNANIRLRRIYFAERLIPEDELPPEYKLYFPLQSKTAKERKITDKGLDKENRVSLTQAEANKDLLNILPPETSRRSSQQTQVIPVAESIATPKEEPPTEPFKTEQKEDGAGGTAIPVSEDQAEVLKVPSGETQPVVEKQPSVRKKPSTENSGSVGEKPSVVNLEGTEGDSVVEQQTSKVAQDVIEIQDGEQPVEELAVKVQDSDQIVEEGQEVSDIAAPASVAPTSSAPSDITATDDTVTADADAPAD